MTFWLGLALGIPIGVALLSLFCVATICKDELGRWWHQNVKI